VREHSLDFTIEQAQLLKQRRMTVFGQRLDHFRSGCTHLYDAQTPACHRTHRRTARRVWRTVVRATHTPSMRVLPGPQPTAICVTMSSS
jgi:hypothetical protein